MPLYPNAYSKQVVQLPPAPLSDGLLLYAADGASADYRVQVNRANGVAGLDSAGKLSQAVINNNISGTNLDSMLLLTGYPVAMWNGGLYWARLVPTKYRVLGLVAGAGIAPNASGLIQITGVLSQPDTDWQALTDTGASLVPNQRYFLNANGKFTVSPDVADPGYLVALGVALSITDFQILLPPPVIL